MSPDEHYRVCQKLIYRQCWIFWQKNSSQYLIDDLIGEANVVYSEILLKYRKHKAQFSTILQISINNHFKNLITKQNMAKRRGTVTNEMPEIPIPPLAESSCVLFDAIEKTSESAQRIVWFVLCHAPAGFRLTKNNIKKHFRKGGWNIPKIEKAFDEIKEVLKTT